MSQSTAIHSTQGITLCSTLNIPFVIQLLWVGFCSHYCLPILVCGNTVKPIQSRGYLNSGSPASFDLAALKSFASSNLGAVRSVSVGADIYTGISLNSFLSSYVKTDPTVPKNDVLRDYVVATGTDGYRSVFSLGELNTSFGNQNDIIAYQMNGADLTTNGFARIIAPGDLKSWTLGF